MYIMRHTQIAVWEICCNSEKEKKMNSAWESFAEVTFALGFEE